MPDPFGYNSMQAQAGLPPPQVIFPGQVSAAIAAQGGIGAFGTLFPSQTYQTAVGAPPIFQGPTGLMAAMNPGAPFNPYAAANPYAGLSSYGNLAGRPSPFASYAPQPPPAYAGPPGTGALPFAPLPAASPFDTPYAAGIAQHHATQAQAWTVGQAGGGALAHLGGNLAGAAAGAFLGSPLGPVGALAGGVAGFLGAERYGVGRAAQNVYGNNVVAPRLAEYGAAQGLEHLSQGFVASGGFMHAGGAGFSHHAAHEAAHGLTEMANSAGFRRDTRDRFNQQDVFRMTQISGETGMLSGVNTPQGVTSRMRDIAKSLSAFMELAKEPDIQRAIQTMGQLRASGLNLHETMSAVASGRNFARLAGTTFQGLAETGGALGSQTFQSMGLSQGLGFQAGMASYGQASSSINQGIINPQIASLVGGREGLATLNAMHSGAQLQLPMVAPGLMSTGGGLHAGAMRNMLSGNADLVGMTGRGSSVLSGMADRFGVGGLGMAVGMQPLVQDSIGRVLQSRGPFAGRNLEDVSIVNMMRQMGLSGSSGFMTAAQMMGMQGTAALARTTELQSGAYWDTQRSQLTANRREARADADREREAATPRVLRTLRESTGIGDTVAGVEHAVHHFGIGVSRALRGTEAMDDYGAPTTDEGRRRLDRTYRSEDFRRYLAGVGPAFHANELAGEGVLGAYSVGRRIARATGSGAVGGAFGGLFAGGADARQAAAADLRTGGAYATQVLNATADDQRTAMSRVGDTFGGIEGLLAFNDRTSQLARGAYTSGDVAVRRMSFGLFGGPRALGGNELQGAFREQLSRQGVSDPEIARRWREEGSTIAQQHAAVRGLFAHTDAEEEVWRHTGDQATEFTRGSSRMRRIREDADRSYRNVLGDVGREGQAGFRRVMDSVEGFGPEGSERNERTRRLMAGIVMAQIAGRSGGRDMQEQSASRIREMIRSSGVQGQDLVSVSQRVAGLRGELEGDEGVLQAARGFVGHGRGIAGLAEGDVARMRDTAARNVLSGIRQYATGGGVLQDVLGGMDENNFSEQELLRRFRGMSSTQRRRLAGERGRGQISSIIERINRGDDRAVGDFMGRAGANGQEAERLRTEYDQDHGQEWGSRIARFFRTYESRRARWVDDRQRATSAGERTADQQRQESMDAEGRVRGAGVGRAGDELLDAARELREVTRNLRDVTQSNQTSALLGRPM